MVDENYEKAKRHVKELKGFYKNIIMYVIMNIIFIVINFITSPNNLWFYWITIFWGLAILFQAVNIFIFKGKFLGKDWEEQKIKKMMDKEDNSK